MGQVQLFQDIASRLFFFSFSEQTCSSQADNCPFLLTIFVLSVSNYRHLDFFPPDNIVTSTEGKRIPALSLSYKCLLRAVGVRH